MKSIIKLTLALMMGIFALGFQSCGSDDKDEPKEPATTTTTIDFSKTDAVVGKWFQTERVKDDGGTVKDEERLIYFNSDGTFEYRWGTDQSFKAKGTYKYTPESKDKGTVKAYSSEKEYTFIFESYSEYRNKVTIVQPESYLEGTRTTVCIFGHLSE